MLVPVPPAGLLAPIIVRWENIKICESGVILEDKFGQIHRHQLFQWVMNFDGFVPMYLEHQPLTLPFFGYFYSLRVDKENLHGDVALTRYGLEAVRDYSERHMGSGWSVGISEGKQSLAEITLCRVPRVSTTHVVALDGISFKKLDVKKYGIRSDNGTESSVDSDIGDQIVGLVREIIDCQARDSLTIARELMEQLRVICYCNNVRIPQSDDSDEDNTVNTQ